MSKLKFKTPVLPASTKLHNQILAAREARGKTGAAFAAPATHPTAQPWECPPLTNRGETSDVEYMSLVVTDSGEVKTVPVRKTSGKKCASIDWVNFSVLDLTFNHTADRLLITDDDHIREASRVLASIFGFGVTAHYGKKLNFYSDSWVLGDDFGFLCYGGQRDTMLVMLNGHACVNAAVGWEKRLHHFLSKVAVRPVLTRIDLFHDDFDGRYNLDYFLDQYEVRGYSCSFGAPPNIETLGNWIRPTGRGRTLNIGRRQSGKFLRVYEKGREQGDCNSPWVRCEVEFKSSDRVLPFDMLLNPSDYFVGAYPCFKIFAGEVNPQPVEIKKQAAKITVEKALDNVRDQFGAYVRVLRSTFSDDAAFLDRISSLDVTAFPKRLWDVSRSLHTCAPSFHELPYPVYSKDYLP